jgi:ribosome-binding factor A
MKAHRMARIAEVVREVASETILFGLRDPRVKGVTVTRAEVSADLQHAKVFVSIMGSDKDQSLCMYGLRHASGYIQSQLGTRLKTRFTPVIHFVLDQGVKKSIEITRLINEALGRPGPEAETQSADGAAEEEASDDQGCDVAVPEPDSSEAGQASET